MSARTEPSEPPAAYGGGATARGIRRVWDPRVWGSVIGAVGATVFVVANRGELGGPWSTVAVVAWIVGLTAYVWCVLGARRHFPEPRPVAGRSGLVYLGSVLGMLALIRVGGLVLESQDRTGLRPALIVLAVGLHFLPFARAFHTPMFTTLGSLMVGLGTAGLALGWFWGTTVAPAVAVVTGLVMLAVIALDAARGSADPAR